MIHQHVSDQALAVRERSSETLLAHSSELIAVVDDQARAIYASPTAERLLALVPEEQIGTNSSTLVTSALS